MTTVSTTLAIGMMPLNLFIYSRSWSSGGTVIPYMNIVIALISILVPALIGWLIRWKLPKVAAIVLKVRNHSIRVLVERIQFVVFTV